MTKEYIEREKVIEVIKNYGKNAINIGQSSLDPVDDIILLQGAVNMILAADVIVPPCKVADLPDRIFSHNSIIAIWVEIPEEHCSQRLWRGMAWDIPEKYREMQFKRIFGNIPESIYEADTINVLVELTREEAEKALVERNKGNET